MKRFILILFLPIFLGASSPKKTPDKVNFYTGTLTSALEKAKKEGKLVFVDFYASWCAPCQLMDEYTFTDSNLAEYMDDKFIPIKINIDDFDGFAYKNQYNINLLPTLLVMNCEGKEIERKEEGLVPSKLSAFLQKNFIPSNICSKPASIASPAPPVIEEPSKPVIDEPVSPKPSVPDVPKPPTVKPPKPTTPPSTTTTTSKPKPNNLQEGLFRFTVQRQPSKGYSVQVGAFGEYGNVLREVYKLQKVFPSTPIIVFIGAKNGRTIYKVLVGEFTTRTKAHDYKEYMKRKGSSGLIKNLEFMQ